MNKEDVLGTFLKEKSHYYYPNILLNIGESIQEFFAFYPDIQEVESFGTEHAEKWMIHLNALASDSINNKYFALGDFYDFVNADKEKSVRQTLLLDSSIRQIGAKKWDGSDFHFRNSHI